jgi:cell division protein ZipA
LGWEWRRSRRLPRRVPLEPRAPDITLTTERPRRLEPGIGEVPAVMHGGQEEILEVPSILPHEPLPVSRESAVDVPAAARGADGEAIANASVATTAWSDVSPSEGATPAAAHAPHATHAAAPAVAIRWPPAQADRVLTLRVVKPSGEALHGRTLRIALEGAGLASGPQKIFHRADVAGAVIVSAAHLVQPGVLDPAQMDATDYRGLSLFSVLPGPLPPVRMLEELVATARSVAHRLGAIVQDEKGADLDGPRLMALRQSLEDGPAGSAS